MSTLSIIICTYNRKELLLKCLNELVRQIDESGCTRVNVVVVDNNSSDGTDQDVGDLAHQCRRWTYVTEAKQGLSYARNRGAMASKGAYLCYLDDDAYPGPEYVNSLLRVIDHHKPDMCGGPVYPLYATKKPFWFQDELEIRCHSGSSGFADCPISGGNFVIRSELLKQLGMFSPDFGMVGRELRLGEERELLERYKRRTPRGEQRVFYSLECFIYHDVPAYKMSLTYFVKRAYQSGKMMASLTSTTLTVSAAVCHKSPRSVAAPPSAKLRGIRKPHILLRGLHRSARIVGMSVRYFEMRAEKKSSIFFV